MKNYHETVSTVFGRMAKYRARQQKRKQVFLYTAVPLGCVCLIGALSFGLLWQPSAPKNIQASAPSIPDNVQDSISSIHEPVTEPTTPPATETTIVPSENKIVIHPIESIQSDMYIALMRDDYVSITRQQLNEYYGINVFPTVPSDIPELEEHHFGIYKRNGGAGEIYHDVNVIRYDNEDYTRTVNVQMSKGQLPFSCCLFLYEDDDRSIINGTEVAIGLFDLDQYYVEFMYQDVGFRIHTVGISEEELVEIISSIIQ